VKLEILEVRDPKDLELALARIVTGRAQGLIVMITPILLYARQRIVALAAQRRLPTIYGDALFVEAGGLMFYGTPYVDLNRRAATVVARVLNGTKPEDIPVEQPTQFKLLINARTARALRAEIPQSVLLRAETLSTSEVNVR
jgi:putative ABC transport system substrate-binding protein